MNKNLPISNLQELINSTKLKCYSYFEYIDISLQIGSSNKEILDCFSKLLYPHFLEINENESSDLIFNIVEDSAYYLKVQEIIETIKNDDLSGNLIMTYCSNDKGTLPIKRTAADNYTIYQTIKTPSFLIQNKENNEFIFVVKEGYSSNPNWFKDGFSFFEHLIHRTLNTKNTILIHASAVTNNEKCILFLGEKRSGKTTLMFEACKKFGFSPISVDKVHLKIGKDNKITAYGFPSRLRALAGTLSKYSPYFDSLIPNDFLNSSSDQLWLGESTGKVTVPVSDFEVFVDNSFVCMGTVTDLVFPKISSSSPSSVKTLDKEEFYKRIQNCSFTPNNPEEDWWSSIGLEQEEEMLKNSEQIISKLWDQSCSYDLQGSKNIDGQLSVITKLMTLKLT